MHRSQKKLVLVNGGFAGESGIDINLYEGGRRGTKRMFEEYDEGKLYLYTVRQFPLRVYQSYLPNTIIYNYIYKNFISVTPSDDVR